VAAGFDRFAPNLIEQYRGRYAQESLGISVHDLLALGRQNPNDASEHFHMAYLAIRGSGAVNGVSRLHGQVSRRLLEPLFPNWPEVEVPVGHVTNGVHMPSWDSAAADEIWTHTCGKDRWLGTSETLECDIRGVSDEKLWQFRIDASQSLVEYARERLSRQLAASGSSPGDIESAKHLFDPNILTLGFGRISTVNLPRIGLHSAPCAKQHRRRDTAGTQCHSLAAMSHAGGQYEVETQPGESRPMRLRVIATDYDGTVATDGHLNSTLIAFGMNWDVMSVLQHTCHFPIAVFVGNIQHDLCQWFVILCLPASCTTRTTALIVVRQLVITIGAVMQSSD
jgi:hypothetical protein